MKRKYETRATSHEPRRNGSALILTVVLTTLLATIGVLFVLLSRLDKMAASAMSENRQLNFAIDTVVAKISQQLVLDVPGVVSQEYFDYPGQEDRWLASLEPNDKRTWPQISDVTNFLWRNGFGTQNVPVELPVPQRPKPGENFVREYPEIKVDPNGRFLNRDGSLAKEGLWADADGDGVADSKWIELTDITSSKGRPIYAAIRIIDNGGMLNVNTAFKFNPADPCFSSIDYIDGHSQLQINLMALAGRPGDPPTVFEEVDLLAARANYSFGKPPKLTDLPNYEAALPAYEQNVIWYYGAPNGPYTPFDISDELEFRYRFLLNHTGIDTRLEGWGGEFRKPSVLSTPVTSGGKELDTWFKRAYDTGVLDPNYAYRHIATTCSMDRVINPYGGKTLNVNTASAQELCTVLEKIINPGWAAQIAVNLIDSRDSNDNVTSFDPGPPGGQIYYGFERPCIYISELDYNQVTITTGSPPVSTTYKSYAIELYKPYSEDAIPGAGLWQLTIDGKTIAIDPWPQGPQGKGFYVVQNQDPNARITVNQQNAIVRDSNAIVLAGNSNIELQRRVTEPNGASKYITVDSIQAPGWLVSGDGLRSYQRDISKHKCIRRLWDSSTKTPTPGSANSYVDNSRPELVQAHPANRPFTNIGEIGMIFVKSAYSAGPNPIGPGDTEFTARLNLADSTLPFQQLFNYLTVFDPAVYPWNDPNETRVKGRININTAPWYVIAQLPWVSQKINKPTNYALARSIVAYRDKTNIPGVDYSLRTGQPGFNSIGELMNVRVAPGNDPNYSICYYGLDSIDQMGFPDLTTDPLTGVDGAVDDFEEGDLIFSRISNLVTVRSDVFTAYILVRIGTNGPQRRVIAILDRSKVTSPTDKVKIIAIQPVPDPR